MSEFFKLIEKLESKLTEKSELEGLKEFLESDDMTFDKIVENIELLKFFLAHYVARDFFKLLKICMVCIIPCIWIAVFRLWF